MITTMAPDDGHEKRWQRWQRNYARSSRKTAIRSRIVIAVALTATSGWLALQLALWAWN